jgi:acyl transferase domain-containing protein
VLGDNGLGSIDVANFNSPTQTVIRSARGHQQRVLLRKGRRADVHPLQVSAAFHSRYGGRRGQFADYLAPMSFSAPRIPSS